MKCDSVTTPGAHPEPISQSGALCFSSINDFLFLIANQSAFMFPAICKDSPNGHIAIEKSCVRYWLCVGGYPRLQRCPAGLAFNPTSLRCELADNIPGCEPPPTTEPPEEDGPSAPKQSRPRPQQQPQQPRPAPVNPGPSQRRFSPPPQAVLAPLPAAPAPTSDQDDATDYADNQQGPATGRPQGSRRPGFRPNGK